MGRSEKNKLDVNKAAGALQTDPFAALDSLDVSALPPGREPAVEKKTEPERPAVKSRGRLILRRETKDRGGKTVVVVSGFAAVPGFSAAAREDLGRRLRKALGCGGTVEAGEIIVQGDQPAAVCAFLEKEGFRVAGVRA